MTEKEKNRAAQFDRLLAASAEARAIREMMIREAKSEAQTFFLLSQPLNYFILNFVYAPAEEGTTEFKKFNEWKSEGYTIKKRVESVPRMEPAHQAREERAGRRDRERTPARNDGERQRRGQRRGEPQRARAFQYVLFVQQLASNTQRTRRHPADRKRDGRTAGRTRRGSRRRDGRRRHRRTRTHQHFLERRRGNDGQNNKGTHGGKIPPAESRTVHGRTTRGNAGDQQRTRRHGGGVQKIRSLRHFERPEKNCITAAPIRAETSPNKAQRSEKTELLRLF